MATIFDGYANAKDEEIIDQIVLLETITLYNVLRPYKNKAKKKVIKIINKVGSIFGKKGNVKEPEVKEVDEMIKENREKLKGLPRRELDNKLREILRDKSGSQLGDSDEVISTNVINLAAQFFNISEDLTPAQKADRIYERFYKRILGNFKKKLKNQTPEQTKRMSDELDKQLKNASEEQRKQIKKMINSKKLTYKLFKSTLIRIGAPNVIIGMSSWKMLLGSNKIDKEMLAQSIWFSVGSYGTFFRPSDEELPSWLPQEKYRKVKEKDNKLAELLKEKDKSALRLESNNIKLTELNIKLKRNQEFIVFKKSICLNTEKNKKKLESRRLELETSIMIVNNEINSLKEKINKISSKDKTLKVELENKIKASENEFKMKVNELANNKNRITEKNEIIKYASDEIYELENENKDILQKIKLLENENEELKQKQKQFKEIFSKEQKNRRNELEKLWEIHFKKFEFKPQLLREVAKLRFRDRCQVEKALCEIYNAKDLRTILKNYNKIKEKQINYFEVTLTSGVNAYIEYKILNDQNDKKLSLVKFHKKKLKI